MTWIIRKATRLLKLDAEIDSRYMEKPKGREREANSDNDSRIEFRRQNAGERHHEHKCDPPGESAMPACCAV